MASVDPAPQRMRLTGLHHLTAIARDLEATTAFYRDTLGLALVREGASDDDPDARHFWFSAGGDGAPGTLISFLEYPGMAPGTVGVGSVQHFAFAVESADELGAWRDYLRERGLPCTDVFERGGYASVYLRDPDQHIVEIATRGPGLTRSPPGPALGAV